MPSISVTQASKLFAFIGTIVAAVLFTTSTFVLASDYHRDNLNFQATLMEMQLDSLEDRIERAAYRLDTDKVLKLEHRRNRLEKKQDSIIEKQLEG